MKDQTRLYDKWMARKGKAFQNTWFKSEKNAEICQIHQNCCRKAIYWMKQEICCIISS